MAIKFKSLVLLASLFYIFANMQKTQANDTGKHHNHHDHHNMKIDIGKHSKQVGLKIKRIKDTMDGWNIQILADNFTFSPTNAGKDHVPGEGHAHLYVNDKKEARLYGSWFYLSKKLLKKGKNKVTISLHANSHEQLTVNGKALKETFTLIEE